MGGEVEGYSIPAQRAACSRKAESLQAVIEEEFVDRGESAKTANRPELMRMLRYLDQHSVDYVIVHKVDRLARNRADDVAITIAIRKSGATLVSCSENIDETPSGLLLHGIMQANRRVLQPKPGDRGQEGHEPEGEDRRNSYPLSRRLPTRAPD